MFYVTVTNVLLYCISGRTLSKDALGYIIIIIINKGVYIQKRAAHTTRYHAHRNSINYKSNLYMQTKLERQNVVYTCRSRDKINVKDKN